jgi:hypothetical protein
MMASTTTPIITSTTIIIRSLFPDALNPRGNILLRQL